MNEVKAVFDRQDQLDRIKPYMLTGETLFAVYDCKGAGTGFVGVTDRRVIFYDQGVVFKKKAMITIPYKNVLGVSTADEGMVFKSSEVTLLTAAGNFSFEFRGADKANWVYRHILNKILAEPKLPAPLPEPLV